MADQLKKGNLNHPLMMLNKGAQESNLMSDSFKESVQNVPSLWGQLLK